MHTDVTVSCSDVRVVSECTLTADVSDVARWRVRGRAGVKSTRSHAPLGLRAPVILLTDCRRDVTGS